MKYVLPAFLLIFLQTPVFAANINTEGAEVLRTSIQEVLDYQKDVSTAFGTVSVIYEGDVIVKPENGYYSATLPHIILKGHDSEQNTTLDMGIITLNATPDEKPNLWNMNIVFPSSLILKDDSDTDLQIHIGSQNAAAVFEQTLGYFTKMDMSFANLTATENGKSIGFDLGKLQLFLNLEGDASGTYSGPGSATLTGLKISEADTSFSVGKILIETDIGKLSPVSLSQYKDKILKHKDTFTSLNAVDAEGNPVSEINEQAVMDMMLDFYGTHMDSFKYRISAEDLSLDTKPESVLDSDESAPTDDDIENFSLAKAYSGFDFNGINGERGAIGFDVGYNGLSISPVDPAYDGVMPSDINLNIRAENLSMKTLSELLLNSASSAFENPDMASVVGLGLMIRLPAILSQAGSELHVKNNYIKGGLYDASLDGKVVTDLAAVSSFTAKFKGLFAGLDELTAKMRENKNNPDIADEAEYGDFLEYLEMVKQYGQKDTKMFGSSSYSYDIEFSGNGQLLINGKPVSFTDALTAPENTEPAVGGTP